MSVRRLFAHSTSALALLAAGVLFHAGMARAATITVPAGVTVGQQVLNDGDVLVVEEHATATDTVDVVVDAVDHTHLTVINHGLIEATNSAEAIDVASTLRLENTGIMIGAVNAELIPMLINSGTIDGGGFGVRADLITELQNSGVIGGGDVGVVGTLGLGTVVNSGTIEGGAWGLLANTGDLQSLVNSGEIVGGDVGGVGLGVLGTIHVLDNSGTISGSDFGIEAGAIGDMHNSGEIIGHGSGVTVAGLIGSLDNSGTIAGGAGFGQDGVHAGGIGALNNSGEILGGAFGVAVDADIGSLVNSGSIFAAKDHGVAMGGSLGSLDNSGSIAGAGYGLFVSQTLGRAVNSGTIRGDVTAFLVTGTLELLDNSGAITGQSGVVAVTLLNLTNSGLIAADDLGTGYAIAGVGGDTVLTLNAGSVLIGHVDISVGNDTLKVGDGLNLALSVDQSVPELIDTGDNPYVVVGNVVHVVDASDVTAASELAALLSGSVGRTVEAALRDGFDEKGGDGHGNAWAQGYGAVGRWGGTSRAAGGFAVGVDFGPDADRRLGAFVGLGRGAATGSVVESLYGGLYGAVQLADVAVEAVLLGGLTEADHRRVIANNMVETGLETATASESGWFVSPQLTLRKGFVTADTLWEASATLAYTGVFRDGYVETGVSAPLTVEGGSSHVLSARALASLPFESLVGDGVLSGEVRGGVVAEARTGEPLDGTLAGEALLLGGGEAASAGLTAGVAFDYAFGGGATLFGGIDGTLGHDMSYDLVGEMGIKGAF